MYEIFERLLKERNLKTADVARATGIAEGTFSNWKKRRNILSPELLVKIAAFFDVSLDYMMGKETEKIHTTNSTILHGNAGTGKSDLAKKIADILMEEHESGISIDLPQEAIDRWERYKNSSPKVQQAIDLLLGYEK